VRMNHPAINAVKNIKNKADKMIAVFQKKTPDTGFLQNASEQAYKENELLRIERYGYTTDYLYRSDSCRIHDISTIY
jgi:hypothetical protein